MEEGEEMVEEGMEEVVEEVVGWAIRPSREGEENCHYGYRRDC